MNESDKTSVARGIAIGAACGLLSFLSATYSFYFNSLSAAAWIAGVGAMILVGIVGRRVNPRIAIGGVAVITWFTLQPMDYPRIGVTFTAIGAIAGGLWATRGLWRWGSVALTVGFMAWMAGGYRPSDNTSLRLPTGQYPVDTLTYIGPTVDASGWFTVASRLDSMTRRAMWGFGLDSLPLRGKIYAPRGVEKAPIVIIVHGSHYMMRPSWLGYDYLGHTLASRGYVAVSIDESPINKSFTRGLSSADDFIGRGRLVVAHIDYLHQVKLPVGTTADFSRTALVGHSRGADAVATATMLLSDDTTTSVKAIVELAPTSLLRDFAYSNLDLLYIHGDKDGDVSEASGMTRYNSLTWTDSLPHLKAAICIRGANHSQFNSQWGRYDRQPPAAWLLDPDGIIGGNEQRSRTAHYVGEFLARSFDHKSVPLRTISPDCSIAGATSKRSLSRAPLLLPIPGHGQSLSKSPSAGSP